MIRASFCFETCRKDQQSICFFTESSFQMAGLPTNFCFNQFALRTFEPGRRREQVEYIEQDRACRTGTNQPGFSLTRSIPYPYTHCIFRSYTHCPGIPETITGTGFQAMVCMEGMVRQSISSGRFTSFIASKVCQTAPD